MKQSGFARISGISKVHDPVFIGDDAVIGRNCKIQMFAYIPDNVVIGDNVFIGPHACFTNDKHPPSNGKWKDDPPTVVENDVVIGANATILPGVVIGRGAVIGAGAIVTKNVESGAIIKGIH